MDVFKFFNSKIREVTSKLNNSSSNRDKNANGKVREINGPDDPENFALPPSNDSYPIQSNPKFQQNMIASMQGDNHPRNAQRNHSFNIGNRFAQHNQKSCRNSSKSLQGYNNDSEEALNMGTHFDAAPNNTNFNMDMKRQRFMQNFSQNPFPLSHDLVEVRNLNENPLTSSEIHEYKLKGIPLPKQMMNQCRPRVNAPNLNPKNMPLVMRNPEFDMHRNNSYPHSLRNIHPIEPSHIPKAGFYDNLADQTLAPEIPLEKRKNRRLFPFLMMDRKAPRQSPFSPFEDVEPRNIEPAPFIYPRESIGPKSYSMANSVEPRPVLNRNHIIPTPMPNPSRLININRVDHLNGTSMHETRIANSINGVKRIQLAPEERQSMLERRMLNLPTSISYSQSNFSAFSNIFLYIF